MLAEYADWEMMLWIWSKAALTHLYANQLGGGVGLVCLLC